MDFSGFNFERIPSALYIYTGIFLSEQDRENFLKIFTPRHSNVFADHVTLCFRPSPEQVAVVQALMTSHQDQSVWLEITGHAEDDKGQAVSVRFADLTSHGVEVKNSIPHMTVSCANGTSPVYSNELLARGPVMSLPPAGFGFRGTLGVCAVTDRNHLPREMWKRRGL